MKPTFSACFASLFALLLSATATLAHADEASDFVDDASARGVAEIEMAKLALKESQAQDVKNFAQMMIDDHTKANQKLKEIAQQKNMEVADDPSLMARAKKWILDWRDGEDFNKAYANNQVVAHEQTIERFREYLRDGKNAELKAYATETLPKLEEHLRKARELAAKHGASEGKNEAGPAGAADRMDKPADQGY